MHVPSTQTVAALLVRTRQNLGLSQIELAEVLGVARRTIGRWEGGRSTPSLPQLETLARTVFPKDGPLAAQIAAEAGATLETLGLGARSSASPSGSAGRPFPPVDLLVDSVLHAAALALGQQVQVADPLAAVEPVLRAAFERARGLGLTLEEIERRLGIPMTSAGAQNANDYRPSAVATSTPASRPSMRGETSPK